LDVNLLPYAFLFPFYTFSEEITEARIVFPKNGLKVLTF